MESSQVEASKNFALYRERASKCVACRDDSLIARHDIKGWAPPLFQRNPMFAHPILFVAEAPTWEISFEAKGFIGLPDSKTERDETDEQIVRMLEAVSLDPNGVLFTNAVLCLPKGKGVRKEGVPRAGEDDARREKYPVTARQAKKCVEHLGGLIDAVQPRVVVTLGKAGLDAVRRIEPHHTLQLARDFGRLHDWHGRKLLPLYHPSLLGQAMRGKRARLDGLGGDIKGSLLQIEDFRVINDALLNVAI